MNDFLVNDRKLTPLLRNLIPGQNSKISSNCQTLTKRSAVAHARWVSLRFIYSTFVNAVCNFDDKEACHFLGGGGGRNIGGNKILWRQKTTDIHRHVQCITDLKWAESFLYHSSCWRQIIGIVKVVMKRRPISFFWGALWKLQKMKWFSFSQFLHFMFGWWFGIRL